MIYIYIYIDSEENSNNLIAAAREKVRINATKEESKGEEDDSPTFGSNKPTNSITGVNILLPIKEEEESFNQELEPVQESDRGSEDKTYNFQDVLHKNPYTSYPKHHTIESNPDQEYSPKNQTLHEREIEIMVDSPSNIATNKPEYPFSEESSQDLNHEVNENENIYILEEEKKEVKKFSQDEGLGHLQKVQIPNAYSKRNLLCKDSLLSCQTDGPKSLDKLEEKLSRSKTKDLESQCAVKQPSEQQPVIKETHLQVLILALESSIKKLLHMNKLLIDKFHKYELKSRFRDKGLHKGSAFLKW